MRDYTGVSPETLPQPDARDFHARLRDMVNRIDYYLLDQSKGIARIQKGEVPDGSGDPIGGGGTLTDYWFLPGRSGGQIGYGGTGPGDSATIASTVDPDKGFVFLGRAQTTMFNEDRNWLGINVTPVSHLHVVGSAGGVTALTITGDINDAFVTDENNVLYAGQTPPADESWRDLTSSGNGTWVRFQNDLNSRTGKWNLSGTVSDNTTHTITYVAKNDLGTPDATTTFRFRLTCADTRSYQSAVINPATAWTTTFTQYTATVVCTGLASPDPQFTANSIEMGEVASVATNTYSSIDYAVVDLDAAPDIVRVADSNSTVGFRIDPTLQVGIGTGTTALTEILTIQSIAATSGTSLLKLLPDASQTANVMEVWNFANTHKDFTIGPGGLVTICDWAATDSDVRLQIRAPLSQATTIFQVLRAYNAGGTNTYAATTVGSTGAVTFGDSAAHGAAVVRLQLRQGTTQTANLFEAVNQAGTASFVTIGATGQLSLGDGTDPTKRLAFTMSGLQTGVTITQAHISSAGGGNRTITWSFTGASGTAGPTFAIPITTVARTYTLPNATVTLAGLQIAQTFTRTQTITPTTGTEVLALNTDTGGGGVDVSLLVTDTASGLVLRHSATGGLEFASVLSGAMTFYPSGTVGSGFAGSITSANLTASRLWTFPNTSGTVMVGSAAQYFVNLSSSFVSSNVVTAAPAQSMWQVNVYLACSTAEAGTGLVTITIGWSDNSGAKTFPVSKPLTSVGATQYTIVVLAPDAATTNITRTITYTPTGAGITETYDYSINAVRLN